MRAFLSYASADRERAVEFRAELAEAGYEVWVDWEQIGISPLWREEVARHMKSCSHFFALATESYYLSDQCSYELDLAGELDLAVVLRL